MWPQWTNKTGTLWVIFISLILCSKNIHRIPNLYFRLSLAMRVNQILKDHRCKWFPHIWRCGVCVRRRMRNFTLFAFARSLPVGNLFVRNVAERSCLDAAADMSAVPEIRFVSLKLFSLRKLIKFYCYHHVHFLLSYVLSLNVLSNRISII